MARFFFLFAAGFVGLASGQTTEAEWQREAVKRFPELGIAGSPFNTRFVAEAKARRQSHPAFFVSPDWPVRLADELVRTAQLTGRKATKAEADSFLGITEASLFQRLGRPTKTETRKSADGPFTMYHYDSTKGRETFFVIFHSDGTVHMGYFRGTLATL